MTPVCSSILRDNQLTEEAHSFFFIYAFAFAAKQTLPRAPKLMGL